MSKKLEEMFNLEEAKAKAIVPVVQEQVSENIEEIDREHDYVQKKLKNIIEQGEVVLNEAAEIASQTGCEPEPVKAFATILKEMTNSVKTLMDAMDIKKKLKRDEKKAMEPAKGETPTIVNNTQYVFSGNPTDLIKKYKPTIDVEPKK